MGVVWGIAELYNLKHVWASPSSKYIINIYSKLAPNIQQNTKWLVKMAEVLLAGFQVLPAYCKRALRGVEICWRVTCKLRNFTDQQYLGLKLTSTVNDCCSIPFYSFCSILSPPWARIEAIYSVPKLMPWWKFGEYYSILGVTELLYSGMPSGSRRKSIWMLKTTVMAPGRGKRSCRL